MLFDGINLNEGTSITNLTVSVGAEFPPLPDEGELFYANGNGTPAEALYIYDGAAWVTVTSQGLGAITTSDISEGTNLYYTDTRSRNAISVSGSLSYNPSTGVISYTLPDTAVTAGAYGSATQVGTFTVDAQGRLTAAGNTTIALPTSAITSGTFDDARIASSNVTQHQAALSITESQIPDASILARVASNETISGNWAFSNVVVGVDPTAASHFATKDYVDNVATGLSFKSSVRATTTGNITLSGLQTIDGVSLIAGNRVLVKDQTTGSQNGIYVVDSGAWVRASDFDGTPASEVGSGAYMFVREGTLYANSGWVLSTADPITLNTTSLTFTQFTGLGQIDAGSGLSKVGSTLNIGTASSSRIVINPDDIDLATVGTPGTYKSVTTDAYGRVTAGTNPQVSLTTEVSGILPIANGGTNAASAEAAATSLGVPKIAPSTPKDGDIRTTGSVVEIYANGAWRQVFPAVYS